MAMSLFSEDTNCLGAKGFGVCNLLSNSSGKESTYQEIIKIYFLKKEILERKHMWQQANDE